MTSREMVSMKYQLKNVDNRPLGIFIDESAKEDFMLMMRWTKRTFEKYTIQIKD